MAASILAMVGACAWVLRRTSLQRWGALWFGMILAQATLGAATILTDKAADVATAHVLLGALSLAMGAMLSVVARREAVAIPLRENTKEIVSLLTSAATVTK